MNKLNKIEISFAFADAFSKPDEKYNVNANSDTLFVRINNNSWKKVNTTKGMVKANGIVIEAINEVLGLNKDDK